MASSLVIAGAALAVAGCGGGNVHEHDPVDLRATDKQGKAVIAQDAHIRQASPENNGGQRILRRGYSFSRGATPGPLDHGGHQLDGGLFFIAFSRDPSRQFVPCSGVWPRTTRSARSPSIPPAPYSPVRQAFCGAI